MNYTQILEDLTTQKTFSLEKPWRLSDQTLGFIVPIIRVKGGAPRQYAVIEEVPDKIQLTDSGGISEVGAKSTHDKPVFMRSGSALSGKGMTQSRAVSYGTVLFPLKKQVLTTVCVQASKGISHGSFFAYAGQVPNPVRYHASQRKQSATWSAVGLHTASLGAIVGFGVMANVARDDLVGSMNTTREVSAFKKDVEDMLKKIPADINGQVGIVVFDANGIVGIELFDHEDSWRAFSKSVTRSYSDLLTKKQKIGELFELNVNRIINYVTQFLEKAKKLAVKTVFQKDTAETFALNGELSGEYTTLNGEVIHAIWTRKEQEQNSPNFGEQLALATAYRIASSPPTTYPQTIQMPYTSDILPDPNYTGDIPPDNYTTPTVQITDFYKRKGAKQLITYLNEEPKTWGFLNQNINVSSRTLSKLTKSAMKQGLVKKKLRGNGRVVYSLTNNEG